MRFTVAEFDTMVHELLYAQTPSFNTLCQIADKTLRPSVFRWCKMEQCLCGRGFEDDLMHDILMRLMNTTVSGFLLRNGADGPYNNDPEGFEDWMFRVASNLKCDFAKRIRGQDFKTEDIDNLPGLAAPEGDEGEAQERVDRLKQALAIVLDADVGVYKVLTWLAQFIFILNHDVTKIKSNELILAAFEEKTLYEMHEMLLAAAKRVPWLVIDPVQNERIVSALQKKWTPGKSCGETKYKEFFMKHNGEVSGKKSISDWVNRMNGMVRRATDPTAGAAKKGRGKHVPENQ